MPQLPPVQNLIFDLGDVLFSWSSSTTTTIEPRLFKAILDSPSWQQYERNVITQAICYEKCSQEFGLSVSELSEALDQARASLVVNRRLIDLIGELRDVNKQLRVYIMSNIANADYVYIRKTHADVDWSMFDEVFTSGAAGTRKPSLSFFNYVIGPFNNKQMLIDDRIENVNAAESCGLRGSVYHAQRDSVERLEQTLKNAILDPVARGLGFLRDRQGQLRSEVKNGSQFEDNFEQLLILELTGDSSILSFKEPVQGHLWNFFAGAPVGTTTTYPDDADTTSLALTIKPIDQDDAMRVIDQILENINEDGIIQMYFDKNRPRIDPFVCVNILSLFCAYNRQHQIPAVLDWVKGTLRHRAYLQGTRYYRTPEMFLYFLHRVLLRAPTLRRELGPTLFEHILNRVGEPGNTVARAIRILLITHYGDSALAQRDLTALRGLQSSDGGWEISWVYMYGQSGLRIGSRGLSTAFALAALRAAAAETSGSAPRKATSTGKVVSWFQAVFTSCFALTRDVFVSRKKMM